MSNAANAYIGLMTLQYQNIRQKDGSVRYDEFKDHTDINYPDKLDVTPFCTQDCAARDQTKFRLVGV